MNVFTVLMHAPNGTCKLTLTGEGTRFKQIRFDIEDIPKDFQYFSEITEKCIKVKYKEDHHLRFDVEWEQNIMSSGSLIAEVEDSASMIVGGLGLHVSTSDKKLGKKAELKWFGGL